MITSMHVCMVTSGHSGDPGDHGRDGQPGAPGAPGPSGFSGSPGIQGSPVSLLIYIQMDIYSVSYCTHLSYPVHFSVFVH